VNNTLSITLRVFTQPTVIKLHTRELCARGVQALIRYAVQSNVLYGQVTHIAVLSLSCLLTA
jgi:hypothetical protein